MKSRKATALLVMLVGAALAAPLIAQTAEPDPLDPAHNLSLPCEALSTPGLVPRSAKNLAHVANVCGFVGTDIEFQSRVDANGDDQRGSPGLGPSCTRFSSERVC